MTEAYKQHGFKYSIAFYPTWECNLTCYYCGTRNANKGLKPGPHGGSRHGEYREEPAGVEPEAWAERFNALDGGAMIDISGGEPFLWPGLIRFLQRLDVKHRAFLTTNLTRPVDTFCASVPALKVPDITASCHLCNPEWKGAFWEKIDYLRERHFWIRVNFVAYPAQLDRIKEVQALAASHHVEFTLEPYAGGAPEPFRGYSGEKLRFLSENWSGTFSEMSRRMAEEHRRAGEGEKKIPLKRCSAGRSRFMIVPDGAMYPCNQAYWNRVFGLGNFLGRHRLLGEGEAIECSFDCACAGDRANADIEIIEKSAERASQM